MVTYFLTNTIQNRQCEFMNNDIVVLKLNFHVISLDMDHLNIIYTKLTFCGKSVHLNEWPVDV